MRPNEKIFFAQCFPYDFARIKSLLTIQSIHKLTILSNISAYIINPKQYNIKEKYPAVLIMARQHPGESPGSLTFEGIAQFLISNFKESEFLKAKFSFLLIPMVNEEGVNVGNYRTGLGGYDFNRVWDHPDPVLNDSVFHLKKWIKE